MKLVRRYARMAVTVALLAVALLAALREARAQGAFYVEAPKDGRIYVFNNMKAYEEWLKTGEMGKSITRIGAGPGGETVVFDSEEAIHLYNFKHGLPGEVIARAEEKKPVLNIGWKDGKTTIEGDKAQLILSNRMQIRFTNEQLGDPSNNDSKGSFRLRRARTKFEGWIYTRDLGYELQVDWADSGSIIQDLNINYDVTRGKKGFQIKGGQFKVPFGRQELTSSGSQQFVDRSIVSAEFARGRDIGVQLWGQTPRGAIEWRGGLFNGAGRNRTANDNDKYQYDFRVSWQPWGDVKYSESDFESTDRPLLALAANYEKNDLRGATTGDDIDREVYGGDVAFKFKGLSVFGEYFHRLSEPEVTAEFRSDGFAAQIGYFVYKRHVEVAVRYATIDPSDLTVADDQRHESGAAVNWFMNKHNLKLQADYRRIENDLTELTDDEARLQMQFIF